MVAMDRQDHAKPRGREKSKKSVVIVVVFFVVLVLLIGGVTLYSVITSGLRTTQRDTEETAIDALINRGLWAAYRELASTTKWQWCTHYIDISNPNNPQILPNDSGHPAIQSPYTAGANVGRPQIHLTGDYTYVNEGPGTDYYYTLQNLPANSTLKVITFQELYPFTAPTNWEDSKAMVIRVFAQIGNIQKAAEQRVIKRSLYEFFQFYPGPRTFSDESSTIYDGGGFGSIHVNVEQADVNLQKGITLRLNTLFKDLKELSTNGYIKLWNYQMTAPYSADDNSNYGWANNSRDGKAPLYLTDDQITFSPSYSYITHNVFFHFNYNTTGTYTATPSNLPKWQQTASAYPALQAGLGLPYYLERTWTWDKYSGTDRAVLPTPENTIRFVVPETEFVRMNVDISDKGARTVGDIYGGNSEELPGTDWADYWKLKHRRYWASIYQSDLTAGYQTNPNTRVWTDADWVAARPTFINKEWWDDLKYGHDRVTGDQDNFSGTSDTAGQEYDLVKFLNTYEQATEWRDWKDLADGVDDDLSPVNIFEHNSGCPEKIDPPPLNTTLKSEAQTNGIYVKFDPGGDINPISDVTTEASFWNPVYPVTGAGADCDASKGVCKTKTLEIDVAALVTKINSGAIPNFNGVVYIESLKPEHLERDFAVVLKNGQKLPREGLTFVTPHNIYLAGDYNVVKYKKSGATTWDEKVPGSADYNDSASKVPPASVITEKRKVYTLSSGFNGFQAAFASSLTFPYKPAAPVNYPAHLLNDSDTADLLDVGDAGSLQNFVLNGATSGAAGDCVYQQHGGAWPGDKHWYLYVKRNGVIVGRKEYDWDPSGTNPPTANERATFLDDLRVLTTYWHQDLNGGSNPYATKKNAVFSDPADFWNIPGTSGYSSSFTNAALPGYASIPSTYNTAIVSPYDPQGYVLERWYATDLNRDGDTSDANEGTKTRRIGGAFVQLAPSEKATVPGDYRYGYERGYGYYYNTSVGIWNFSYNTSFADPNDLRLPPGDISGASRSTWRILDPADFKSW